MHHEQVNTLGVSIGVQNLWNAVAFVPFFAISSSAFIFLVFLFSHFVFIWLMSYFFASEDNYGIRNKFFPLRGVGVIVEMLLLSISDTVRS